MRSLEQKLFFKLLERWAKRNYGKIEMPNGCLCLIPNLEYDLEIKSSTILRTAKPKTKDKER